MKFVSRDADGATVPLRRGAENLTVLQRHVLCIHGDMASDRLGATGDRGVELTVRQPNLEGFHLDGAAVPERRLRRDRALLTGEPGSAIDKNGATISAWTDVDQLVQGIVCGEEGAGKTHGLCPRQADRAAVAGAPIIHVKCTPPYRDDGRSHGNDAARVIMQVSGINDRVSEVDPGPCF